MGGKAIITNAVKINSQLQVLALDWGWHSIWYNWKSKSVRLDWFWCYQAITAGKGYNPVMTWNAAGGYYQAEIKGDDPFMAALVSKAGAGYAAGNIIKVPADKVLNPMSKQYEQVLTGVWTITKPAPQSPIPSIIGNTGDSFTSGVVGEGLNKMPQGGNDASK